MTEGGYYQSKRLSPTGVTVVVLLHGAALAALMTAKMEMPNKPSFKPIDVFWVPPPPPPPDPTPPPQPKVRQPEVIDKVPPIVETPPRPLPIDTDPWTPPPLPGNLAGNDVTPPVLPPPPSQPPFAREPTRTLAQLDPRSELQPAYPASAQRAEAEGIVQVRVTIGTDGRVKAVEKVQASRDDFFLATERQALRAWRFKPAMVDGKPVESTKLMTVRFRLDGLG